MEIKLSLVNTSLAIVLYEVYLTKEITKINSSKPLNFQNNYW